MRRIGLLISVLAASMIVSAGDYDYEFTPVVGGVWKEGNQNLDNEFLLGGELQFNNLFESSIKPELSILYSPSVDYDGNAEDTDFARFMANGVYEFDASGSVVPFAKAGLGYEYMTEHNYDNHNSVFVDAGAGVKFPFTDQLALKLEALYMSKYNDNNWNSNLAGLVGLTFSFGSEAQPIVEEEPKEEVVAAAAVPTDSDGDGVVDADDKCPNTPKGVTVDSAGCPLDSDGDGVADYRDKCPDTPTGVKVDEHGCPLDSDGDGVPDYLDDCPNSAAGFRVGSAGCPLGMSLMITYEFNSAKIKAESKDEAIWFAKFLQDNPEYKAKIIGHTDNVGTEKNNQKVSKARAESLRTFLIENGIDASRLTTEGKGESKPIADNNTKEGRDANRRIEVELTR